MEINDALLQLGGVGKWQVKNFLALAGMNIINCFHTMAIVFIGYEPIHECKLDLASTNHNQQSSCQIFINASNQSSNCQHGWIFPNFTGSTIVTEWGLLCDKDYLPSLSQTLLVTGFMLGTLLFTRLIDKFGRKKLNIISTLAIGAVGCINAFLPNIYLFSAFRFIIGFFIPGICFSSYVLLCESFPLHQRIFVGVFFHVLWSFAVMVEAILSYFITSWRYFQLAISITCFLYLPILHWIRESVLWDISNGRREHAEETLRIAAKMNGVTLNEPVLKRTEIFINTPNNIDCDISENKIESTKKIVPNEQQSSLSALFGNKTMLFYLLAATFMLSVNICIFFGLSFSTGVFPGNRFSNAIMLGFAEIPSLIVTYVTLKYFGRKKSIQAFHVLSTLSLWLSAYFTIRETEYFSVETSSLFFNFLNKFSINASFAIVYLYISEIFPVNIRATGLGIASFVGRGGTLFGVYGAFMTKNYGEYVFAFYGALSLAVAILIIFLPETHNKPLPNTVQEACDLRKEARVS